MLKYGTPNERKTNLNFDIKTMARASGLLLGKNKTEEYLKFKTTKELLRWIGELEEAALIIQKNRNAEFPKDLQSKSSKESLENERRELVSSILSLRNLYNIESSELESLIRIRSKNQYEAINKSSVESIKNKEGATEVTIRVAQKDLTSFVNEGERTGYSKLTIEVPEDEEDYIKGQLKKGDVLFLFRDELTQRPEPKRIAQGNKLRGILRDARSSKKTPKDIAKEQGATFTGNAIQLSRNSKITDISEKKRENGVVTLEISALLPEVREAINKDPKGEAGRGAITDRQLKQHCSNEYGCNGRDFLGASKMIVESLNKNLLQATKQWFSKDQITEKDTEQFLEEYYTLTICLDQNLDSLNNLEDARTIVKSTDELVPSKSLGGMGREKDPETAYALNAIGQQVLNMPASASIVAGQEWLKNLKERKKSQSVESPQAKEYNAFLEKTFAINDVSKKIGLIEENFYRIPNDISQEKSLDGGPAQIQMVAHQLSNELIEKYEETKEKQENEIFDSKSEELKDYEGVQRIVVDDKEIGATRTVNSPAKKKEILDKAEFIRRQKKISLSLPYRGEVLRRLTKYPYRSSGLDFERSEAEKFDNEISLSPKPRKATPKMPNGGMIRIEDCLSPEGLEDLKIKSNQEEFLGEIARIKDTLEAWQTNKLISPSNKNPIDRNVYRWLVSLTSGQTNEKANSLEELSRVMNSSVANAGRVPYESERSPDRFATPLRSSPVPLMLLCGVGFDRLANIKNGEVDLKVEGTDIEDPAKAYDLTLRWTNAENLHRMPLKDVGEAYIEDLEAAVASGDEMKLIEHAASIELSSLPDFKTSYLESIGTTECLVEIDEENKQYKDLVQPLSSSPLMMVVGGEEMPISEMISFLEKEGIKIDLTETEKEKIELSPEITLDLWRKDLQKTVSKIDEFFAPVSKEVFLDVFMPEEGTEETEEDPFLKAISELHENIPQSADQLKSVVVALLAHNPQKLTLSTQEEKIILTKGSDNKWTSKGKDQKSQKATELVNQAQSLILSKEKAPEDHLLLQECEKEAGKIILFENIGKLGPAIQSLPQSIVGRSNIRELRESLSILTKQLERAKASSQYGHKILSEMEDETPNAENPWGHSQTILNPRGTIDFICGKIAQEEGPAYDSDGNKLPQEKTSTYFSRQLISQDNKEQAVNLLKTSGLKTAALYLKEELEKNKEAILQQASQSLPDMVKEIRGALTSLIEHSHTEKAKEVLSESNPIAKIIKDKYRGRLLEKKINDNIELLRAESKESRNLIDKLISPRALRNKVSIKVNDSAIITDKLWAKSWLSSKSGLESVSKRVNTAQWVKDMSSTAKARTAIAFLEFCHHRGLGAVPEAISKGNLTKEEKEVINESVVKFQVALEKIGIDTKKSSLKTQLLGGVSLNSIAAGNRVSKVWSKDWEAPLKGVKADKGIKLLSKKSDFQIVLEGGVNVESPYLKAGLEKGGVDPESDLENADPKTKLRTVKRAMSALYQAVPFDMGRSPSKPKEKVKSKKEVTI